MINETMSNVTKPKTIGEDLRGLGGDVKEMATERLDQVRKHAVDAADTAKDSVKAVERNIEKFVRDEPVKALLVAVGVGLILGRFLMK